MARHSKTLSIQVQKACFTFQEFPFICYAIFFSLQLKVCTQKVTLCINFIQLLQANLWKILNIWHHVIYIKSASPFSHFLSSPFPPSPFLWNYSFWFQIWWYFGQTCNSWLLTFKHISAPFSLSLATLTAWYSIKVRTYCSLETLAQ